MFDEFLDHKCNIYHLGSEKINAGYGIKATSIKRPHKEADEKDVKCHFHIRSNGLRIIQKEPYSSFGGEVKLSLPIGTDIRKNDMVEDCRDGLKYRASNPKEIHGGHHIIVTLFRDDGTEAAI